MKSRIDGIIDNKLMEISILQYRNQSSNHGFINICDNEDCYIYYDVDNNELAYCRRLDTHLEVSIYQDGKYIETYNEDYI